MSKQTHLIPGPAGQLEAILNVPDKHNATVVAVLCHPHPQFEGTMHNKVVTTLERVCDRLGICSVRFNFRGVEASAGVYDNAIGETADALTVITWMQQQYPGAALIFAGFSFGSYIALRAAQQIAPAALISIAPPVAKFDFMELAAPPCPWLVVQGEQDEVVAPADVYQFVAQRAPAITLLRYPETTHYFHGKLAPLQHDLTVFLTEVFAL